MLPSGATPAPTPSAVVDQTYVGGLSFGNISVPSATTAVTTELSGGLTAETNFDVWMVSADAPSPGTPTLQLAAVALNFTTGPDVTPPVFVSPFPRVVGVEDFAFIVEVMPDEPGRVAWVVVLNGTAMPTPADVFAGTDGSGDVAAMSGVLTFTSQGVAKGATVAENLLAVTAYNVWLVAEDDEAAPNRQALATLITVTTLPDATPPVWAVNEPNVTHVEDFLVRMSVTLDEPGTVHWVMIPHEPGANITAPSSAQVVAGLQSSGVPATISESAFIPVGGLQVFVNSTVFDGITASTTYSIWVVAADDEGVPNVQAMPVRLAATTLVDTTPPVWEADFPNITRVEDFAVTVDVALDEPGMVYYVVVASPSALPNPSQVLAGLASGAEVSVLSGSAPVSTATSATEVLVTTPVEGGLKAQTSYDLYLIAADDEAVPNSQTSVVRRSFTTLPDTTPPRLWTARPITAESLEDAITVTFALDEPGMVYWSMTYTKSRAPSPSVAQVLRGEDGNGADAYASGNVTITTKGTDGDVNATVTGLPSGTYFTFWLVTEDNMTPVNRVVVPLEFRSRSLCKFVPHVTIDGPSELQVRPSQGLSLLGVATPSGCLDDIVHEMEVFWSVESTVATSSVDGSFSLVELGQGEVLAASAGPDPRVLSFAPNALRVGHVYRFVATTRSKSVSSINGSATVVVEVVPDLIVAGIVGNSRLGFPSSLDLRVDAASASVDLDTRATAPLVFSWSCVRGDTPGTGSACVKADSSPFIASTFETPAGVLVIPAGTLPADQAVTFTVTVSAGSGGGLIPLHFRQATASATYTPVTVAGSPPTVTVDTILPAFVDTGADLVLSATATTTVAATNISSVSWSVTPASDLAVALRGSTTKPTLVIPAGTLVQGKSYRATVSVTDTNGASAEAFVRIATNPQPSGGGVMSNPVVGRAAETQFRVKATAGWSPASNATRPLQYRFGYRRVDAVNDMSAGAGVIATSYSFATFVDMLLPNPESGVNVSYHVLVQVRDSLGTESEVVFDTTEPVLVMPVAGYDVDDTPATSAKAAYDDTVASFVDASLAAGDYESLYRAVGAADGLLGADQSAAVDEGGVLVDSSTVTPCDGVTCSGHGSCRNADGACVCQTGYSHDDCSVVLATAAVHGGYTAWSGWTSCSAECGGGLQHRYRSCTSPSPAGGGTNCSASGAAVEERACNAGACVVTGEDDLDGDVNGGWSDWSEWGACDAACVAGVPGLFVGAQVRTRSCTAPARRNGGAACPGDYSQSRSCNTSPCPGAPMRCPGSSATLDAATGVPTVECSGLGTCVRLPVGCTSSDPLCTASCACHANSSATGSACDVPVGAAPAHADVRSSLVAALVDVVPRVDTSSPDALRRFFEAVSVAVADGDALVRAATPPLNASVSAAAATALKSLLSGMDKLLEEGQAKGTLTTDVLGAAVSVIGTVRSAAMQAVSRLWSNSSAMGTLSPTVQGVVDAVSGLDPLARSALRRAALALGPLTPPGAPGRAVGAGSGTTPSASAGVAASDAASDQTSGAAASAVLVAAATAAVDDLAGVEVDVGAVRVFGVEAAADAGATSHVSRVGGVVTTSLTLMATDARTWQAVVGGVNASASPNWSQATLLAPVVQLEFFQSGGEVKPRGLSTPMKLVFALPRWVCVGCCVRVRVYACVLASRVLTASTDFSVHPPHLPSPSIGMCLLRKSTVPSSTKPRAPGRSLVWRPKETTCKMRLGRRGW